jgi:MerR family transcriptional regulator, copper efflux regulator
MVVGNGLLRMNTHRVGRAFHEYRDFAKRSGVPAKTIRYYESIGLIASAGRSANGYRVYTAEEVETLRFVSHARSLGFSVKDVANLLTLWRDRSRASSDVKALARGHIAEIDAKIAELRNIRETLLQLVDRCHGDDRPDCPILESLATSPAEPTSPAEHCT